MELLEEPSYFYSLFGVALLLLLIYRLSPLTRTPRGLRLPPGPPGKLIVGNAYDMPKTLEYEKYTQWAKEYGNLFSVKVFNQRMVFVNSATVANDLFEKRSALYSDRFDFPMVNDLMGFDRDFALMRYGDRWRRHRRMFHHKFHPVAVAAYHDAQTRQVWSLLRRLHQSPDDFLVHMRHLAGAIVMEVVYGIKVLPKGDPYIAIAERAMKVIGGAAHPGTFLVDHLPFLKYVPEWFPGASFRKKARIWRGYITDMHETPFGVAKKAFESGTADPSYTTTLLEELSHRADAPADEADIIRNTGSVAYSAGTESTAMSLTWFVLAMVLYPEVQRKAQAELDAAVGPNRMPTFDDKEHLPYINAICKELYRWHPVAPLGIAHRVTQDDVYGDFFIPGGSIVVGNVWAILHDENVYGPATDQFVPERFLKEGAPDPSAAFGFGRRSCPGRPMADNTVFIGVASILQVFDIAHAKDADGRPIPVQVAPSSGSICRPSPFRCSITPRSVAAESLLLESAD